MTIAKKEEDEDSCLFQINGARRDGKVCERGRRFPGGHAIYREIYMRGGEEASKMELSTPRSTILPFAPEVIKKAKS